MATIQWDELEDRRFEAGIDRAVLYDPNGVGVAWNGITAVEEENNTEVEPVYFDGIKFNDLVTLGEYSGVLRAFTYPDEFAKFDGIGEDQDGVLIMDQPPRRFHLSYRTMIGDAVSGLGIGYKIHLLYNLTANAASKNWETLGLEVEPLEFEWAITAIPEDIDGWRPTAHLILDTRKIDPWLLQDLEEILYGSEEVEPRLPSLKALTTFIRKWDRIIVTDNGDGTWTVDIKDETLAGTAHVEIDPDGYFELTLPDENITIIDPETYQLTSSEKNLEDL